MATGPSGSPAHASSSRRTLSAARWSPSPAPRASWTAGAAPLVLVLALVGTDVLDRRRAGRRALPSPSAVLLAAILLVACAIVAGRGAGHLAEMLPIFGSCAALPAILRLD